MITLKKFIKQLDEGKITDFKQCIAELPNEYIIELIKRGLAIDEIVKRGDPELIINIIRYGHGQEYYPYWKHNSDSRVRKALVSQEYALDEFINDKNRKKENNMTKADVIFKNNITRILEEGVFSEQARPKYKDGTVANSKYVTGVFAEYDLSKGEFPITTLRPIPIKSAIKELLWIYQDQTNSLAVLNDKYNVHYWNDWEVGDTGTIGERYGAVVKKHDIINKILKQMEENPWNRRNIISLWDYQAFEETDGLLPCAFQTMFDVRRVDGEIYLDATLTQRSNDMLVAHHINAMQYVALQMMIAKHFGWKVGKFFYFINNLHIYDNQFEQAQELLRREPSDCQPRLVLNVPDGTNFFDIKDEDFELLDYEPVKPQLKFDLAI